MAEENVKSVATENAEPVISQAKARQKVRFVIITEGQGGANIGMTLKSCLPNNP